MSALLDVLGGQHEHLEIAAEALSEDIPQIHDIQPVRQIGETVQPVGRPEPRLIVGLRRPETSAALQRAAKACW